MLWGSDDWFPVLPASIFDHWFSVLPVILFYCFPSFRKILSKILSMKYSSCSCSWRLTLTSSGPQGKMVHRGKIIVATRNPCEPFWIGGTVEIGISWNPWILGPIPHSGTPWESNYISWNLVFSKLYVKTNNSCSCRDSKPVRTFLNRRHCGARNQLKSLDFRSASSLWYAMGI